MSSSPGDNHSPVTAQIEAEIADHLATSAERLKAQGLPVEEAQRVSQQKFGDEAAISRRCYWVKQGDAIMFRTIVIVLLAGLSAALGFTTLQSIRSQRQMAEQMVALAEQLRTVAQQQQAAASSPPVPSPAPLEITGRAYLGSPEKPAKHTRITVIDVKDGRKERTIATDDDGNFNSGPLGGGEFALLAETDEKADNRRSSPLKIQSAPIGVYPGVSVPRQQFDISFHPAALAIDPSQPLPRLSVEDRYTIETRLMLRIYLPQDRSTLWISDNPPPLAWPAYLRSDNPPDPQTLSVRGGYAGEYRLNGGREQFDLLDNEMLERFSSTTIGRNLRRVPAGKVQIAAAVLADVFPAGFVRPAIPKFTEKVVTDENRNQWAAAQAWQGLSLTDYQVFSQSPLSIAGRGGRTRAEQENNDQYFWYTKGLGNFWLAHLQGPEVEGQPPVPHLMYSGWLDLDSGSVVTLSSGQTTRLRIEIPNDVVSQIQTLVDSTTDPTEFAKAALGEPRYASGRKPASVTEFQRGTPQTTPLFRQAKITVVGTEELASGTN